jgi:hypothetical protein
MIIKMKMNISMSDLFTCSLHTEAMEHLNSLSMDPFDHEEHNGQAFNGRIEITMINRYP